MARTLDDEFYDPVPGYTPDPYKRRPTPAPADVPRGGMPVPGPLGPAPAIPDEPRETYADPLSATRGMRYGAGDERDLSVPVIDPRDPLAPAPATWGAATPYGAGRRAYSTNGGYAYTNAPAVPDETTPRVPFADAAGESFAATAARGARMQKMQDDLGLTTADMDYIRTYGRAAYDARQAKYGQPTTREDYLRQQQGNLAASVAARRAAENELSRIERDNEAQRRREDWAREQAARLEGARIAASVPVSFGAGTGVVPDGNGGWTPVQPPATERPRNVQRRGDGALVDGDTGEVISEMPAPPADPNAGPWVPGGGATSVNRVTGDIKTAPGASQNPPVQTGRYTYKEGRIVDTATGEYQELPPRDRKIVVQEMIDQLRRDAAKAGSYQLPSYEAQIHALEGELRGLSGEPDPTPAEAVEVKKKGWWGRLFGGSDEPEAPAPGGASSPSEPPAPAPAPTPAPAPAAPAAPEAKPAPKGYKRLPNGELEWIGS